MAKATKTVKIGILLVIIIAAGIFFTSIKRETIGEGRVGVLLFLGGHYTLYQAGDMVTVWPGISQLIVLSQKPVLFSMQGDDAIKTAPTEGKEGISLSCQVRYKLTDPAKLIISQGAGAPQQVVEGLIRTKIHDLFAQNLQANPQLLGAVQSRIIFVAETTHQLNLALNGLGISILSFDLLDWQKAGKS